MTPVVPISSAIFHFASRGDLNGVIKLLTQGLTSPFDVDSSSGMSALMVSQRIPIMTT